MFVTAGDTHQFLTSTSSHPYHCKKEMTYIQGLRLNRICSDNDNFNKRCNNLEKCWIKRGYNKKMTRKQILRAWEHMGNDLRKREKPQMLEQKLTFNNPYNSASQSLLEELLMLLTHSKEHKKVFPNVPML